MSKIACAGNTDPLKESRSSSPYSPILFSMGYSWVCVCPEVVHNFCDSFHSSCRPWPYAKPTVSRRNEYGRSRRTWVRFRGGVYEKGRNKPMNIVRYLRYPQSDLSAALDRITSMRAEMDRMYDSTFGSSFPSPAPLSGWNPAVNVYQDKDQFIVVAELPGLKKEEIEISLHEH